jgi:hypothetical protein
LNFILSLENFLNKFRFFIFPTEGATPMWSSDVVVRVHRSYHLAMHVDTDEANAFNSDTEPYGVIVKFFDSNFNTDKWIEDELSGIRR